MLYVWVMVGSALAITAMFYFFTFILKKSGVIKPVEATPLTKADLKYRGVAVVLAIPLGLIILFSFWALPWMGWFWLILTVVIMAVMFTKTNQTPGKTLRKDSNQGTIIGPTLNSTPLPPVITPGPPETKNTVL